MIGRPSFPSLFPFPLLLSWNGSSNVILFKKKKRRDHEKVKGGPTSLELTSSDWDLLLRGAKRVYFRKGDVVLQEGTRTQRIVQVINGYCRIEKVTILPLFIFFFFLLSLPSTTLPLPSPFFLFIYPLKVGNHLSMTHPPPPSPSLSLPSFSSYIHRK